PDHNRHGDYLLTPPGSGSMPRQERGQRPTRPLGYVLSVTGQADGVNAKYILTFASSGTAGATFLSTRASGSFGPWPYTCGAGTTLSDKWSVGGNRKYDLSAYGPNGFLRRFAGTLPPKSGTQPANPEVTSVAYPGGNAVLTIKNTGAATCTV